MGELKLMQGVQQLEVKGSTLYDIRTKYQRAENTDAEGLVAALKVSIDKKKPSMYEQEIMSDILGHVAENIERMQEEKAARERSAEEWRQMEYEYATVREGKYSMTTIEALPGYDETQYIECAHRFCITAFIPKRKNAIYCCEECRKKEHQSNKEYDRTSSVYANGTYLPVSAYMSTRASYRELQYMEHERLFDEETLQLIANADADEFDPTAKAANRERRMRESTTDYQVRLGKENPCPVTTYKLSEMSAEEIEKTFEGTQLSRINPSSFLR